MERLNTVLTQTNTQMRVILIVSLLVISFHSYGKYYPATLVFEHGRSREGFVDANLGDEISFKGWMESEPEKIPASAIKTIWIKTNGGHKMHEYHYVTVDTAPHHMWLKLIEKGAISLYVHQSISQQDGVDITEALEFFCLREGETNAKQIASHNNKKTFASSALQFFADKPLLVEKIRSKQYHWENVQELVHNYNQGL